MVKGPELLHDRLIAHTKNDLLRDRLSAGAQVINMQQSCSIDD